MVVRPLTNGDNISTQERVSIVLETFKKKIGTTLKSKTNEFVPSRVASKAKGADGYTFPNRVISLELLKLAGLYTTQSAFYVNLYRAVIGPSG